MKYSSGLRIAGLMAASVAVTACGFLAPEPEPAFVEPEPISVTPEEVLQTENVNQVRATNPEPVPTAETVTVADAEDAACGTSGGPPCETITPTASTISVSGNPFGESRRGEGGGGGGGGGGGWN
ncbi:MAG: hypothetical protein AAGB18_06015 [Pseudomonadota bacterium]